ncbi:TPR domain-containing protein [Thecamonas trahens ATCC 50062]|uniref:TPR domain-containing protein n=1 Tax=Thecamonas trahens ATCC 50062 TaxID=461836 RepID=A0A0L0DQY3_THETB|nr:TPR domain-containing protein [Thecamonas trahens ATCC 50062]KNC54692.1 TPR domain-containing protein [Thecamonas trahens ATCC 50062]|eukprot:XP_013761594.1 TPR domain-containing protein [Thecamonas trahens ATCC 50062]
MAADEVSANVAKLLGHAEACMAGMKPDAALKFVLRARDEAPDSVAVLELLGEVMLEVGDATNAIEAFKRAIEVAPEGGSPARFMYMGQLSAGSDAVSYYSRGVAIMQQELAAVEAAGNEVEAGELRRQISNAFVSMADIYLTDACEEDNAESECERLLQLAVETDETNYEALQSVASMRISQCRNDDAEAALDASANLWSALPIDEKPSSELQIAAAQLYMELKSYDKALQVLASALEIDQASVEAWFLAAICEMSTDQWDSAAEHLLRARTIASALNVRDKDFDEALNQRLAETQAALEASGLSMEPFLTAAAADEDSIHAALSVIDTSRDGDMDGSDSDE